MANFFNLTSNDARRRLEGLAKDTHSRYGAMISDYRGQSDQMIAETMRGFEDEMATLKKRRGFRDPLEEFSAMSGLRSQAAGTEARAAASAGLGGAARMASAQIGLAASAQAYNQSAQLRAQSMQRNTVALHDLLKTSGSIRSQMQISQLQGISSMRSAQLQSYAQMQTAAQQMSDRPTAFAGLVQGGLEAYGQMLSAG